MKLLNVALAASLLATGPAHAVVTTDGSLGGRQVTLRGNFDIPSDLGKAVDSNLFHSFSTFNLDQGESATFTAPPSIHNIISRVTGGHPSTIDGSIFSTANLYLVNPSGITFGRNAFVDVSGSFHATTADYLRLGAEGRFDATLPANTVLTAAPPSAFGFLGANPKPITVTDSRFSVTGTLGFVGGDITITDGHGINQTPAGFDLVSVASAGEATLTDAAIETSSFSDMGTALLTSAPDILDDLSVSRGRIFISAGAFIIDGATVWGVGDEDITIRARDSVMIRNGSVWGAGKSGNLSIVSPSVTVDNGNINLGDVSETGMVGNPGDLTVSATDVEIINGGRVQSFSQRGRGGDINITASGSLTVSGTGLYGEETVPSGIVSSSAQQSAGNITLDAPTITVEKGAEILVRSTGSGEGNLKISSDRLSITDGEIHNSAYYGTQPTWSGGNIDIKTGTFTMSEADLWTSASGSGDGSGAKISIDANIVSLSGDSWIVTYSDSERGGEISIRAPKVSVDGAAIGGAAKLTISAGDLEILNGGLIATYYSFESRGGDININATGAVTVSGSSEYGSSQIRSSTFSTKDAGNITINSNSLLVDGGRIAANSHGEGGGGRIDVDSSSVSLLNNGKITSEARSTGSGGIVGIDTGTLTLQRGVISTSSDGEGDAGNISINAHELSMSDKSVISSETLKSGAGGSVGIKTGSLVMASGSIISTISGQQHMGGGGRGGKISITASDTVSLDDAQLRADTYGSRDGGDVTINGDAAVTVQNSGLITSVTLGKGDGGNITIDTGSVNVIGNGTIATHALSDDEGKGGNISITAKDAVSLAQGWVISTTVGAKNAGHIDINAPTLTIDGGFIDSSTAFGTGNAGTITVHASDMQMTNCGAIGAVSTNEGDAGNIEIEVSRLSLSGGASIQAWTGHPAFPGPATGSGGSINISAAESILVSGSGVNQEGVVIPSRIDVSTRKTGNAGTLTIKTPSLVLENDAVISSQSLTDGNAGSVTIQAGSLKIDDATLSTTTKNGEGGRILIVADEAILKNNASIDSSTDGSGNAGSIDLITKEAMVSGSTIKTCTSGTGDAGDISLDVKVLNLVDGGQVQTNAEGLSQGKGGHIVVEATEQVAISGRGSSIATDTAGTGDAGSISVIAPSLSITDGGSISARSSDTGNAGSIALKITDTLAIDDGFVTTEAEKATGGNITIDPSVVYLRNGSISTSVNGGLGNGGNISLAGGSVVLGQSRITANAIGGNGGNVDVTADVFIADPASLITASSQLGLPGRVDISAPLVDVSGNLMLLPEGMLKDNLTPRTCAVSDDSSSSFLMGIPRHQKRPGRDLLAL